MERVWIKNYQSGIPEEINPDSHASICDLFLESCQRYKDKPAFVNMGKQITFGKLEKLTKSFASYLQNELQLQPGDRIALMMPNLLQYPIAMFGAMRAGLVVVNINPLYTAKELQFQLNDSGATAIVILENFAATLEKVIANTKIKYPIVTKLVDMFDFSKAMAIDFVIRHVKKMVPNWKIHEYIKFKDVLAKGKSLPFTKPEISNQDIAFLQYTGGTTGVPKAAMLTHRNIIANIQQALVWVKNSVNSGNEIIITALPLYHIFSLTANCLVFLNLGVLNVLITNPRDIPNFVKELGKCKFSIITGVNTLFNALLNDPKFAAIDFSSLRLSLGGGMAVQSEVAKKWHEVTGCVLLEGYGLTETSPIVCIDPLNLKAYNSSIGLPLPSTDIQIRDEQGKELGFDEAGELCIRGPQVMQGYWQKPEETAIAIDKDGWLLTGDIAVIDQRGFIKIVDRKKDMIIISGFKVFPNEVEDVIASLDAVKEVAVIGISSGASGEAVKACVVKKSEITTAEIIAFCKANLTAYKVPKYVDFYDDLPKTSVGKILRKALRDSLAN